MTKEEIVSLIEKDFSTKKVADYLTDMPTDVKTLFSYLDNKFEHKSTTVGMPVKFDNPRVRDFFHLAHRAINGRQYGDNDIDHKTIFIKKYGQKTYDAILKVLDNNRVYLKNGGFLSIDTNKFGVGKIERIVFSFPQIYGGIDANVDLYLTLKEKYVNLLDEWELSFISEVENIINKSEENKGMTQKGSVTNAELDKALSDLHRAEKLQETMKKANAIIRSKKNVTERLISEAGMSESSAIKAQQPDYAGRVGFATYQLTNNNASIKRLQERVKMLEKKVEGAKAAESGAEEKYTFDGGVIKVNYEEDRVQILLDSVRADKPMYQMFRKNGYVFSPTNKAFQRKITPQAIRNAVQLMKATKVVSEGTQLKKGIDVEKEHAETFEKLAAGKITPEKAIIETAKEHISEDSNYYDKLEKIAPEKKLVKLNRDYNGLKEGTIGEVIKAPNMFVKEVKFGDKTITIDNNYVTKVDKIVKLRFPELPNNHPLNILDPESPQYKEALEEERRLQDSTEEVIEPNTGDEFDEIIMSLIEPKDSWKGNLMKERDVKSQIYSQLAGPESEKQIEVERIFQLYSSKFEGDLHEQHNNSIPQDVLDAAAIINAVGPSASDAGTEDRELYSKALKTLEKSDYRMEMGELRKKEPKQINQEIGDVTALTDAQLAKYLDMLALPTVRDVIQNPSDVKKAIQKEIEKRKTDKKQLEPENNFKGVHHNYKNQYELNKAIEALLIERAGTTLYNDSSEYSSDEKNFIRKYSGYGGLDKYGATGKGGLFEYYTPKEVIERMWALAYKYGYNNGSMLETSIGIGEFLQYAPKDIRIVGYEINEFSAKICKILYPTAEVNVQPFEKTFIGKNNWTMKDNLGSLEKFDLVIGNPPYGDFSVVESRYMSGMGEKDHTKARNYVEYFIRRGLDLLKPGGLLIYIIGAQLKNGGNMFLDSGETPVKEYLAANCELLDAYRLPDSVFERTGVTSDIIVLKKS